MFHVGAETLTMLAAVRRNRFYWRRTAPLFGQSQATVTWDIPDDAAPGTYRIRHFGHSKNLLQMVSPYEGSSSRFKVNP